MRHFGLLTLVLLVSVHLSTVFAQVKKKPRELTFGEVRTMLAGQKIVINSYTLWGNLSEWHPATLRDKVYEADYYEYMPASYKGREAEVIAVQLNSAGRTREAGANAQNQSTNDDLIVNPYFDVVVKFSDGRIAITTSFASLIFRDSWGVRGHFIMLSDLTKRAATINSQLPSIVGKVVYGVTNSRLYPPTASIESLTDRLNEGERSRNFPRLQPLSIVAATYSEKHDVVVLKLKDVNGKEYLCVSEFNKEEGEFLERVVRPYPTLLLTSMEHLTDREIAAVRAGSRSNIYVGMPGYVLRYIMDFPEKKNDLRNGEKEEVYDSGRFNIYLDSNDRVKSWKVIAPTKVEKKTPADCQKSPEVREIGLGLDLTQFKRLYPRAEEVRRRSEIGEVVFRNMNFRDPRLKGIREIRIYFLDRKIYHFVVDYTNQIEWKGIDQFVETFSRATGLRTTWDGYLEDRTLVCHNFAIQAEIKGGYPRVTIQDRAAVLRLKKREEELKSPATFRP